MDCSVKNLKANWSFHWHFHIWTYVTYLHRSCIICARNEKRKPGYFAGTNLSKFESLWKRFSGSDLEFIEEAERFNLNLNRCWVHRTVEEKVRFGKWAIYNECVARQDRAFPHYGLCVLYESKL